MKELGHERGEAMEFCLCISIFNDNVFPLHVSSKWETKSGASSHRVA
jgi:hypothetical protein